jgi:hypothetical protein
MMTAQLYGKTISGKTMTEIKRKASRIANDYWNMVDRMEVTDEQSGNVLTFMRINRKSPNNAMIFGKWQ